MKKDLKSFHAHDKDYGQYFDLKKSKEVVEKYKVSKFFETAGFERAIKNIKGEIKTHIDIGSGTGWLLIHTSPFFEKVIGIEPSKKALGIAKEILTENNIQNALYINKDMVDAFKSMDVRKPVFLTTAVVFSHIKDFYVKEFLKLINELPRGSELFFDEPYEKNIQQNLWHVRSKEWWAKNLDNWELDFFEIPYGEYRRGIHGVLVGRENVTDHYNKTTTKKIYWMLDGVFNKIGAVKRKISKKIK